MSIPRRTLPAIPGRCIRVAPQLFELVIGPGTRFVGPTQDRNIRGSGCVSSLFREWQGLRARSETMGEVAQFSLDFGVFYSERHVVSATPNRTSETTAPATWIQYINRQDAGGIISLDRTSLLRRSTTPLTNCRYSSSESKSRRPLSMSA